MKVLVFRQAKNLQIECWKWVELLWMCNKLDSNVWIPGELGPWFITSCSFRFSVLGLHPHMFWLNIMFSLCCILPLPIMHDCCLYKASCFPLLTLQQLLLTNVLKITGRVRWMGTLGTLGMVGVFRAALWLLGNEGKSSQQSCNIGYIALAVTSWGNHTVRHVWGMLPETTVILFTL